MKQRPWVQKQLRSQHVRAGDEDHAENVTVQGSPAEKLRDAISRAMGESVKNHGNLSLTERSSCFSLWVVSRNGRRDGYDLFVSDQTDERRPVVWAWTW